MEKTYIPPKTEIIATVPCSVIAESLHEEQGIWSDSYMPDELQDYDIFLE